VKIESSTTVESNDEKYRWTFFAREFLLPRPYLRDLHLKEGMTAIAIRKT